MNSERKSSGESSTVESAAMSRALRQNNGSGIQVRVTGVPPSGVPVVPFRGFSSRQMSVDNLSLMGMRAARQRQMGATSAAAGMPVPLQPPQLLGARSNGPSPAMVVRDARGRPIRLLRQTTIAAAETSVGGGASMRLGPEGGADFGAAARGAVGRGTVPGYSLGPGGTRLRHRMGSVISLAGIRSNGQPIYCMTSPTGLTPVASAFGTSPVNGLRILRSPGRNQEIYYPEMAVTRGGPRKYLQVRSDTFDKTISSVSTASTSIDHQKQKHRAAGSAVSGSRKQADAAGGKSPAPSVRSFNGKRNSGGESSDQSPTSRQSSTRCRSDMESTPCTESGPSMAISVTPAQESCTKPQPSPLLSSSDIQRALANSRMRAATGRRRSLKPKLSEPLFDLQMLQQVKDEMRRQNSDERARSDARRGNLPTITSQGTEEMEATPEYENVKSQSASERLKSLLGGIGKHGKLTKGSSFQSAEQSKHLRKICSVESIDVIGRQTSNDRSSRQQQQPLEADESSPLYETIYRTCKKTSSSSKSGNRSQPNRKHSASNAMTDSVPSSDGELEEELAAAHMRKRSMGVIKESAERLCTEDSSPAVDTPDSKPGAAVIAMSRSVSDLKGGSNAARSRAPKLAFAAHKFMSIPDPTEEEYEQHELDNQRHCNAFMQPPYGAEAGGTQLSNRTTTTITNCFGMPSFSIAGDEMGMPDLEMGLSVNDLGEAGGLFADGPAHEHDSATNAALPPPIHPSRTSSADTGLCFPSATGLSEHTETLVDLPLGLGPVESAATVPTPSPENFDPIACLQSNWRQTRLLDS